MAYTSKTIAESKTKKLISLLELYKENKFHARVKYFNSKTKNYTELTQQRVVLFEEENGNFAFVVFRRNFGISSTSKLYNRETKEVSLIYKNGKFYFVQKKRIKQMTYQDFAQFANASPVNNTINTDIYSNIQQYFINKFSWIRFISEHQVFWKKAFNTFTRNGLYNFNDSLKFFLKVPLPVAKQIHKAYTNTSPVPVNDDINFDQLGGPHPPRRTNVGMQYIYEIWSEMRKVLINVENLSLTHLTDPFFIDLCKMSRTLDRKVNCSWGLKRIEAEHNSCARDLTLILMDIDKPEPLTIHKTFLEFTKFSGFKLLDTSFDLLMEGKLQQHCVGGYVGSVNDGSTAIFHIKGFTLELRRGKYWDDKTKGPLYMGQFQGRFNASAPQVLKDHVMEQLLAFNAVYKEPPPEKKIAPTPTWVINNPCAEIPLGDPQPFHNIFEEDEPDGPDEPIGPGRIIEETGDYRNLPLNFNQAVQLGINYEAEI